MDARTGAELESEAVPFGASFLVPTDTVPGNFSVTSSKCGGHKIFSRTQRINLFCAFVPVF